jgi:RecA/RadA recombinase
VGPKLGVNIDDLLVSQPDTGEQALDICELLVRSNAVDVIVVDSVAALIPRPRSRARWATRTSASRPAS